MSSMTFQRKRRILTLLSLIAILYISRDKLNSNRFFSFLNRKLTQYTPWKILIAGYTIHYLISHALSIVGFGVRDLPEQHYHPDFVKVRKLFAGLDAGIVSTLHVRPKWLRDIVSIILGAYFIIFNKKAEDRMHRFHQEATIEGIRACWCKSRHPLLWAIAKSKQKIRINIHRRLILIDPVSILNITNNTENLQPIQVYLYFQGTEQQLSECRHLVINYPGGGFITMNHLHHESYVQKYANYLHIPIISVNYRKAPEDPYPAGFNDAYYTYKCIVATNGRILGLNTTHLDAPISIALTGDSAGGNFVATVCCRAIVEDIKKPDGLLLAYPVLELNIKLFRHMNDVVDFDRNDTNAIAKYGLSVNTGDILRCVDNTPLKSYVDSQEIHAILKNAENELTETQNNYEAFNKQNPYHIRNRGEHLNYPLTSRFQYMNDQVLPLKYILIVGEAYMPTNADPMNDMYLSPLTAPLHILSKFPMTRIHVGSVDPLVDDSRRFTKLLRYANSNIDVKLLEWDGVSHAYMQSPSFLLRQARFSVELAVHWLSNMLKVPIVDRESFKYDYDQREKDLYDATDDFAFLRSRI